MLGRLRITCDEATTICDKNQYGEATFMEVLKLQLHFLECKICPKYTKQNNLLTKLYKNKSKVDKEAIKSLCMSLKEKEAMKKAFEEAAQ